MKALATFELAAACLSICSGAIQLHRRADGPPRVVGFPIERQLTPNGIVGSHLRRRDKTVQVTLDNYESNYYVNVTLGTPPQNLRLLLDTGTADTWVNAASSDVCTAAGDACLPYGTFDANASSTYSYIGPGFNLTTLTGDVDIGEYATDTLTIGSTTFSALQIGISHSGNGPQGLLGIGYPTGESQVTTEGKEPYNNLPAQMVAQGLINSNAYSLWLDDVNASTGSILFGGVDTARYHGSLTTLPLQNVGGTVSQFPITLTGMTFNSVTIAKNMALAIALISGDSLTYLPNALAQAIFQEVGAHFDPVSGNAFIPCTQASVPGTLNFTFSSVTISVPMTELVLNTLDNDGGIPETIGGEGVQACVFGIAPALGTPFQLGDTFLRSAYVVFDIENNEVSLAQTNFDASGTDVVEIGTGTGSVPNATPVLNAVSATQGTGVFNSNMPSPTAVVGLGGNTTTSGVERVGSRSTYGFMIFLSLMLSFYAWI
ncbi:aspartic proteinase precursor [Stipitochalara longipes BDJ]|nr:aspartic proteinase precursor [Stipitochalara longipes BDJ]